MMASEVMQFYSREVLGGHNEPSNHFIINRLACSYPRHVTIMDHPHLPTSPEEEEEFAKQESFISNWESEQNNKSFLDMTLPELNQLIEKTNDRTTDTDTQ